MNKTVKAFAVSFVSFILSAMIMLSLIKLDVSASVSVPDSKVDLYFLSEPASDVLTIPSKYKTKYQIKATGSSSGYTYSVVSGDTVIVSSDGLVTVRSYKSTVYNISTGTSTVRTIYNTGKSTVRVSSNADNSYKDIVFNVNDYASVYCEKVMDDIIKANITSNMTVKQKVEKITKYTAEEYDYNGSYSSAYSMIIYGGGDCWASTDMIISLCKKCGLDAWSRNGNRDPGAGSGHRNAVVADPDNNCWYECEAGYSGTKPRYYYVATRTDLFSYQVINGEAMIYQYDGKSVPEKFVIPSEIGGYKVTSIADSFIHSTSVKKIILPSTLKSIGDYAFSSCSALESITIPSSVTSIGQGVFASCSKIKTLTVDSANKSYTSTGNVIYTKDKTSLITAPTASSVSIPSTVTSIAPYAFYYNPNIKSITIPSSVKTIGEGAFGNCANLGSLTIKGNGLSYIGNFAFAYTGNLRIIELPSSVSKLGNNIFYYSGKKYISIASAKAPKTVSSEGNESGLTASYSDDITLYLKKGATGYNDNWKNDHITLVYAADPVKALRDAYAKIPYEINMTSDKVVCGKMMTLTASLDGETTRSNWKSSDSKIATVDSNGNVTAKMAGKVTITATAAGKTAKCTVTVLYKDVINSSDFWYAPTNYLTAKGVVKGYANQTEFRPANNCTRAQMVTFLYRLQGEPKTKSSKCKFDDVKSGDYFYKPVIWAVEQGITTGVSEKKFNPQGVCTRAQTVTFLWRMAGKPEPGKNAKTFSDVNKKDYFYKATLWASDKKILAGYDDGTFKPQGKCLRRQMVTFLYKYDKYVNGKG